MICIFKRDSVLAVTLNDTLLNWGSAPNPAGGIELLRIFYYLSGYISHCIAGLDYVNCLKQSGHTLCVVHPESGAPADLLPAGEQEDFARKAELVILHEDPAVYPAIYAQWPFLKEKRVVGYVAWENEILNRCLTDPLQLVSEVWTCSDFCRSAISPHVRKCSVLPHLVQRGAFNQEDARWVKNFLRAIKSKGQEEEFIFLSVVDAVNPRKNLQGLLTAFNLLLRGSRRPVRLLLKQYRMEMKLDKLERVSSLAENLSKGRMNALYALCDAYVSAHHAEGWGMGLSSAMAFGKPVIATGYSGNMHYMNAENSLPVPYVLAPVSDAMLKLCYPLFTRDMRWADPDLTQMAAAMRKVAEKRFDAALPRKAAAITGLFGPEKIKNRLNELLESSE
ncbi:MAG: glycosyltransferase [Deltaproteobacteria bacterium]|nr:glycosyltransferase [Deltaproteobacteria bacterium]